MREGVTVAAGRRASSIGVAAVAGVMAALGVASFSHAQRAEPPAAALASEASGQRGNSIVRAPDTRPEPGSSARAAFDRGSPRHPGFHRTSSVDYAIVLAGEIYALMDEGEVLLKQGDVLVQRGTNHAWSNRSDAPAYLAFVLIDAEPL
jgi:quercetin dioxygenase-like cupin family protein